jgi:hypothetical protein
VRPVLDGQLPVALLQRNGGPFDIGRLVNLGKVQPCGSPPEVEDHRFNASAARAIRDYKPKDYWGLLAGVAKKTFSAIFGPALQPQRSGAAVAPDMGTASLGCLLPATAPVLSVSSWGTSQRVRIQVSDGVFTVDLSVTDVRFHEHDHWAVDAAAIQDVQRRIRAGVPVILSVGLARAYQVTNDTEERHWLQVNGVHLGDDPVWQYT